MQIVRLPLVVAVFGPNITLLSPPTGPVGQTVRIDGYNFGATQGGATLTFNGVTASVSSWTNNTIICIVPSTTTGMIVINRPGFQVASAQFTVTGSPAPFNFYVAPSGLGGSNSNNGLFPTFQGGNNGPFETINFGCNALSAGQALGIRGATYNEFLSNPNLVSGISTSQRTTLGNYNNENVILKPSGNVSTSSGGIVFNLDGVTRTYSFLEIFGINLDGSLITNYNNVLNMVAKDPNTGGFDTKDILWRDCSITGKPNTHHFGCVFSGVSGSVTDNAQFNVLGKRHIYRNILMRDGGGTGRFTHPFYITGDECEISGSDIGLFRGMGIHAFRSNGVQFSGLKFFRNRVHDALPSIDGQPPGHSGISCTGINGFAYDNLIYDLQTTDGAGGSSGLNFGRNGQGYNNTIVNCGKAMDAFGIGTNPYTLRNILTFNNASTNGVANAGSGQIASNNNLGSPNPQFANIGADNYHLTASTPAAVRTGGLNISATITGAGMTYTDLDNVVWASPNPSVGCYQFLP